MTAAGAVQLDDDFINRSNPRLGFSQSVRDLPLGYARILQSP
jgi:hypothetical protein